MSAAKKASTAALEALIEAHAVELKLPTLKRRFRAMAEEATREQQSAVAYLGALLEAEVAERRHVNHDGVGPVQAAALGPVQVAVLTLVAGHRRLVAAKLAGIANVPVHVRDGGNARSAALAENLHREDLDPIHRLQRLSSVWRSLSCR